jgi:hypothetical protein
MSDHVQMAEVEVSMEGMVKNILSLNYTHQTAVKEYLNNILDKNISPDYEVTFNLKNINRHVFMFECIEKNACGFKSLEEVTKAFRIADSERIGANNMGYGIFSPITINKDHEAFGLFIQNNEHGSFFSTVYFGSAHSKLWTVQGSFSGTTILGHDVSELIVPGGTRFVWFTTPDTNTEDDELNLSANEVVKFVRKYWRKTLTLPCIADDTETDIMELGKYYRYYLDVRNVPIYYGRNRINPIDFLVGDTDKGQIHKNVNFNISTMVYDGKNDYRIHDEGEWKNFTKSSKNTIGELSIRRHHAYHQEANVSIYDIDIPSIDNKTRKLDRKIWVKIGETYIFCEDFPLNGYPNLRVVLELENNGSNDFGLFISPDANKSNSKINPEIKDRISALVKYTIKRWNRNPNRVHISDTLKHAAWEFYNGNCCRAVCSEPDCTNEITAWKYDVYKIDEDEEAVEKNLRTICKACAKKI